MNLEAERKLKYDRRLHRRSGWISKEELASELSNLPDASDKIHVPDEEPPAPPTEASPVPGAGDPPTL